MKMKILLLTLTIVVFPLKAGLVKQTWLRNLEGFSPLISSSLIKSTKMSCFHQDGSLFNMETVHSFSNPNNYSVKVNFLNFNSGSYKIESLNPILTGFTGDLIFTDDWRGDFLPEMKDKKFADLTFLATSQDFKYSTGWTIEEGFHSLTSDFDQDAKTLTLKGAMRNHFHVMKNDKNIVYIDSLGTCEFSIQVQ